MLASITSLVEQAVPSLVFPLGAILPELTVLAVFLLSYGLFNHLGALEKQKRAALKVKVEEASPRPTPKKVGQHPSAPSRSRSTKALEAQMLKHLEQHEFTRALNLYRSAKPEDNEHSFSEGFYTAFIESAVRVGKTDVVERILGALKQSGLTLSEEFWRRVLKMLSSRKHFSICLSVHTLFKNQLPSDKVVWSCLANASLEVGEAWRAGTMLEEFAKADITVKDHVLFFRVYLALKDADSSEATFRKLGSQTSSLMLNQLLLTCVTSGQPERALRLLHEAHEVEGAVPLVDTVSYNTVIKGLARAGMVTGCFNCLRGMVSKGLQPDDITFVSLLDVCIEGEAMGMIGEIINTCTDGKTQAGTVVYTLFIKGLVRANCLAKALELCEEMKHKAGARPDVVTYSVLIKGLVDQHDIDQALELVEDMKNSGHVPDDIILTHLLEGCRFAGRFDLGKRLFTEMLADGLKPSEFTLVTMLKLCGRVGAHQEAYDLVEGWEATYGFKPSVIHYTCLMSGCLHRKQYDFAWAAYELMKNRAVAPDACMFSTLLPAMVAAKIWERVLAVAKDALGKPVLHQIPPEALHNALAQMQAAEGQARRAAELRGLMHAAGVPNALRRMQPRRA